MVGPLCGSLPAHARRGRLTSPTYLRLGSVSLCQVLERIAWTPQSSLFKMIKEQQEAGMWPLSVLQDRLEPRPLLPKPGVNNASNANGGTGQLTTTGVYQMSLVGFE